MIFQIKALLGGALVVATTLAVGAVAMRAPDPAPIQVSTPAMDEITTGQRHSMQDFIELREGMSYDAAARALGHLGHEILIGAPDSIPGLGQGADDAVYQWPNQNGSRIVLVFKGDRMVQKVQTGLH